MTTVKFLSYQSDWYCTVKVEKEQESFIQHRLDKTKTLWYMFYYVTVQVCLMQKASELRFYWSNRYYKGIIVHQGASYGGICSSRSSRFTAYATITHNKQTSLTWKPMLHSLLWYFLMGVCMFARTTSKDALAVKVTFSGFPRFLPALH